MQWLELLRLVIQSLSLYVLRIDLLLIVGVVLFMIYSQYKRAALAETRMFGVSMNNPAEQMGRAVAYGLLGGVLVTAVFLLLGVSLSNIGIWQLWVLAVLLMMIHPRFMCFSYGAGLLALSHLLFGFPDVDIPALMALVAILHLVEAILIRIVGAQGATPIFVRHQERGVVGGFMLQKYWPIPFVALIGALVPTEVVEMVQSVSMPEWWPIIKPGQPVQPGMQYAFALFPVVAALGYSDVALTCMPAVKARRTARRLLMYSLGLLGLSILAQYATVFAVAAALFSPLAHEWVIRRERRIELTGVPRFAGRDTMVLDVHPDSPAAKAGLKPGDVITAVNGMPVETREQLSEAFLPWLIDAELTVEDAQTSEQRLVRIRGKIPPLGVILIPRAAEGIALDMREESLWKRIWLRWAKRWRKSA